MKVELRLDPSRLRLIQPLTEDIINGKPNDWVLLKLSISRDFREWLDDNKKMYGVTYSEYIRDAITANQKCKTIFKKLVEGEHLKETDYKFLQDFINKDR